MLYISELCEDCAVANEIDYEIDDAWTNIHGIYDNGPRDHGVWRLTLTAYERVTVAIHDKRLNVKCCFSVINTLNFGELYSPVHSTWN